MSGVSFLPFSDHTYQQAPYEDLTDMQYLALSNMTKHLDTDITWEDFIETEDNTEGAQQLACTAGHCEI
jgi:ribonucleoside-diphosphate reductase alpha chain